MALPSPVPAHVLATHGCSISGLQSTSQVNFQGPDSSCPSPIAHSPPPMTETLPRIGIDYTAAIHQDAGIGRSVRELVRALVATEPGIPLELFVAGGRGVDLPAPPGL